MDENKFVISVDLGVEGAIAIFPPGKDKPEVWDIPVDVVGFGKPGTKAFRTESVYVGEALADIFRPFRRPKLAPETVVVLEKQIIRHHDGKKVIRKVFEGYGLLCGICHAFRLNYVLVEPSKWKPLMGLEGVSKEGSRQLAIKLWPGFKNCKTPGLTRRTQFGLERKSDHNRAEAMLLGWWWRLGGHDCPQQPAAEDPEPPKKKPTKKKAKKK